MSDWKSWFANSAPEVKRLFRSLLQEMRGLPSDMYVATAEDVEAGEWSIAFESLCDQAEVYQVPLTDQARADIHSLGLILNLPEVAGWIADNPKA